MGSNDWDEKVKCYLCQEVDGSPKTFAQPSNLSKHLKNQHNLKFNGKKTPDYHTKERQEVLYRIAISSKQNHTHEIEAPCSSASLRLGDTTDATNNTEFCEGPPTSTTDSSSASLGATEVTKSTDFSDEGPAPGSSDLLEPKPPVDMTNTDCGDEFSTEVIMHDESQVQESVSTSSNQMSQTLNLNPGRLNIDRETELYLLEQFCTVENGGGGFIGTENNGTLIDLGPDLGDLCPCPDEDEHVLLDL